MKNAKSLRSLQNLLKTFGDISGLRSNKEKTEAYWLGSLHHSCENIGLEKINKPIKISGEFFSYKQKFLDINFENIIKSINKSISAWQWRNLTLLGRIQIVKTFAIPKFMFRAAQMRVVQYTQSELIRLRQRRFNRIDRIVLSVAIRPNRSHRLVSGDSIESIESSTCFTGSRIVGHLENSSHKVTGRIANVVESTRFD